MMRYSCTHMATVGVKGLNLRNDTRRWRYWYLFIVDNDWSICHDVLLDDVQSAHRTSTNSRATTSSGTRTRDTGMTSSSTGARQVVVEVPGEPWTRPFATVRLRPRRTDDGDRYQSSSGTLLRLFVW